MVSILSDCDFSLFDCTEPGKTYAIRAWDKGSGLKSAVSSEYQHTLV